MSTLKEFLKAEGQKLQQEESEAARICLEWSAAIDRLYGQIESWLSEADPDKLFDIWRVPKIVKERRIGGYNAPELVIRLGKREITVNPVARYVDGPLSETGALLVKRSLGRVDMSNGLERYMLFRIATDPQDRWSIIKEDKYSLRPLDQDSFESAIRDLLE